MTRHDTTVWQVELDVAAFISVVGGLYMLHSIFVVYILGVDIFSFLADWQTVRGAGDSDQQWMRPWI
jgi:hypothetical protein